MPYQAARFGSNSVSCAEVVAKAVDAAAVEAGPERRLAHRDAAHLGQRLVVVRGPRDHVDVGVDVVHGNQ